MSEEMVGLNVRVGAELRRRLKAVAAARGETVRSIVIRAIEEEVRSRTVRVPSGRES